MKVNGELIRTIREKQNIAVERIAKAADLGARRINQIEAGYKPNVNLNVAKSIARALGVQLDKIAG